MTKKQHSRRIIVAVTTAAGMTFLGLALAAPANAATAAQFNLGQGVLTVLGDPANNTITVGRDAAGAITVNGGAVPVKGIEPTVANVKLITILGRGGNDTIALDEANGPLPVANILGGVGNDTLTGGSGNDRLSGEAGDDTILGKGGADNFQGGYGNDVLFGGDGDDQAFGGADNDRLVWNPGDDTDLNEGGDGLDTVEVNGGNVAEIFTATANNPRVRFDRVDPVPFSLDIGTSEELILNANGGDDRFSASGDLAALIHLTVDGGAGNDTLDGGNGVDTLIGGDGDDRVDGNGGNDLAELGTGNDTFQWDPGDGSDTVEGQAGQDRMVFNGAGAAENVDISANGQRVHFFREPGAITMDLDGVERVDFNALGGADLITVNDLSGTDLTETNLNLAGTLGGSTGDNQPDAVVVNGTGDGDAVTVIGSRAAGVTVSGLHTAVRLTGTDGPNDGLTVNTLAGDDVVEASGLAADAVTLTADGGDGDDVLVGSAGNDVLLGGAGDDVLNGGPGLDLLDGGPGANIVIQ